jgi:Tfp pilus assembly protein PilF
MQSSQSSPTSIAARFADLLGGTTPRFRCLIGVIVIAAASFVIYRNALSGEFVLDDDTLLTDNAIVKSSDGLYRFWCTREPTDYWPVSNSTFWLEWRIWGATPNGYHVTNLILHVVDSVLVWMLLRNLGIPGAYLAALLFAIHPVNVESVAWISQRKNLLGMFFSLLSLLAYFQARSKFATWERVAEDARAKPNRKIKDAIAQPIFACFGASTGWYATAVAMFLLAMLSKGSVAALPVIILILNWWQDGRISRRSWLSTIPFFAISLALTYVNVFFQTHAGITVIRNVSFLNRLLGAGAAVWFYLGKAIWPTNLSFVYPKWEIDPHDLHWWLPLLAAIAVTVVLVWGRKQKWGGAALVAWGVFCTALLPALGFVDVGFMRYSLVADHYQHLALIPVLVLAAAAFISAIEKLPMAGASFLVAAAAMVLVALGVLSSRQASLYASREGLYVDTLEKNPASALAHNNLGVIEMNRGQNDEAERHFLQALEQIPDDADVQNNLGVVLTSRRQYDQAIERLRVALESKQNFPRAHNNLGIALAAKDEHAQAIEEFKQALMQNPDFLDAYANLARSYAAQRRFIPAVACLDRAIQLALANGQQSTAEALASRLQDYQEKARDAATRSNDAPSAASGGS